MHTNYSLLLFCKKLISFHTFSWLANLWANATTQHCPSINEFYKQWLQVSTSDFQPMLINWPGPENKVSQHPTILIWLKYVCLFVCLYVFSQWLYKLQPWHFIHSLKVYYLRQWRAHILQFPSTTSLFNVFSLFQCFSRKNIVST